MNEPAVVVALICAIGICSYRGHRDADLKARWMFNSEAIRLRREYHRLITSAGLHADLPHFVFNAITILLFGSQLNFILGSAWMLVFFFTGVLGGSLFSYWLNRDKYYLSLGASGGACGLIFACIFANPGSWISLGLIPLFVPGWAYAIIFIVGSYIAHLRKRDNIGHASHLGGAISSSALVLVCFPSLLKSTPWTTWGAFALLVAICVYLAVWPHGFAKIVLTGGIKAHKSNLRYQRYDEPNPDVMRRRRLDALLDIIAAKGPQSLNKNEQRELHELSAYFRGRQTAQTRPSGVLE